MRSVSRSIVVAFALLVAFAAPAGSTPGPKVSLSVHIGPPTTTLQVSGTGFGPSEEVVVFFDSTAVARTTTDGSGAFAGVQITVPADAAPGTHPVHATGQISGLQAEAPFLVRTNWSMLGFGSQRRSENPYENVVSPSNVAGLHVAWSTLTRRVVRASPAIAAGLLYTPCGRRLCAFDATTGAPRWSFPAGAPTPSSPATSGGVVYAACGAALCALNGATGALIWSFTTGVSIRSSPAVLDGVVYVISDQLYALNASTGALLWSSVTGAGGSPAVANGVVFALCAAGTCALNASNGSLLWSAPQGGTTSPAVANGVVYVTSIIGTPPTGHGVLNALNASTGAVLWSFEIDHPFDSSPAVANGLAYAGSDDGAVWAIKTFDGTLAWTSTVGGRVFSTPALGNGVLYVGNGTGLAVIALDAATGANLWSYTTAGTIRGSAAIVNGTLYIGSDDHTVYAFGL